MRVEVRFGDEEGVVLRMDLVAVGYLGEVERGAVLDRDGQERPPAARRRQSHDLAEEVRRRLRVAGGHDGVVEGDRHGASLPGGGCRS